MFKHGITYIDTPADCIPCVVYLSERAPDRSIPSTPSFPHEDNPEANVGMHINND